MLCILYCDRLIQIVKKKLSKNERVVRNRMQKFLKIIKFLLNLKNDKFSIVIQLICDSRTRFIIDELENENEIERSNILTKITFARILFNQ